MLYLSTILLSVFITVSLIPMMTRLADRFQIVDFPNPRKIHTRPVPRIGGFAMALGAVIPIVLWTSADDFLRSYLAGAGILVIFGLLDDMKGLGYKVKFAAQVVAALIVVVFGDVRIGSLGTLLPGMPHADGFELLRFAERTGLTLASIQTPLAQAEAKGLLQRDLARAWPTAKGFDFLSDLQALFLQT